MSETEKPQTSPDRGMIESTWAEARDLIRRLEGSSVQRLAVAAALAIGPQALLAEVTGERPTWRRMRGLALPAAAAKGHA